MRLSLLASTLAVAATVAGCGGSTGAGGQPAAATSRSAQASGSPSLSASASSSTSSSTTSATTSTAASTPPSTASAGGAGGASVAGPGECRASGLALRYLGGQGATGHGELGFALSNTTSSSCSTGGYPGIQFLDSSGRALPTTPTHTTSDFFGTVPLAPVTVKPGDSFSFRLGVSHGGGSASGCVTARGLQVIPPNDTATLRVSIPGGASECGTTTVSPVAPGTSAFH